MTVTAAAFLENFDPRYVNNWVKMGVDQQVNQEFPIETLCTKEVIEGRFSYEHSISDLPLAEPYAGAYTQLNPVKGFKVHYETEPYGGKIVTEEDAINDDISGKIPEIYKGLSRSIKQVMQIAPQQLLVDGFTTGLAGVDGVGTGDGQNYFANAHPVSPGSADTYDNYYTGAWSLANLETFRLALLSFPNMLNIQNVYNNPDTIICGRELATTIMEDLQSVYKSWTVPAVTAGPLQASYSNESNIVNVQFGMWRLIVCPHIRGNKWYVCDFNEFKRNFKFKTNGAIEGRMDYVFENRMFQHAVYERHVVGINNPCNIIGSDATT